LFLKGKDTAIPKGTEVTAYVHGDVRLDEAQIRALPVNSSKVREAGGPAQTAPATGSPTAPAMQKPPAPEAAAPPQAVPAAPPTPARAPGITNADIIALRAAGFSDDLILAKIKSSRCAFRMDTGDMIELKKAGVSDRVIGAMMDKMQ
jgi:hypothetical protein